MKDFIVFDAKEKSIDRYTIIKLSTGDIWGSSHDPFHPQGFSTYGGNINEFNGFQGVDDYIARARSETDWLGEEITDFTVLPENVQKYINQISIGRHG
jgi:hypothetical protein